MVEVFAVVLFCVPTGVLLYELWGYPIVITLLSKLYPKHVQNNGYTDMRDNQWDVKGEGTPSAGVELPFPTQLNEANKNGYLPFVSIVIPAFNEDCVIRKKIENLLAVDYPEELREIVVASDGSTDRTDDMLTGYGEKEVKF